jgi:hypothetical protein
VNQSAGPLADGCDPLFVISIVVLQVDVYRARTFPTPLALACAPAISRPPATVAGPRLIKCSPTI